MIIKTVGNMINYLKTLNKDLLLIKGGYEGDYEFFDNSKMVKVQITDDADSHMGNIIEDNDGIDAVCLYGRTH